MFHITTTKETNEGFSIDQHQIIAAFREEETYKYLGFLQLYAAFNTMKNN